VVAVVVVVGVDAVFKRCQMLGEAKETTRPAPPPAAAPITATAGAAAASFPAVAQQLGVVEKGLGVVPIAILPVVRTHTCSLLVTVPPPRVPVRGRVRVRGEIRGGSHQPRQSAPAVALDRESGSDCVCPRAPCVEQAQARGDPREDAVNDEVAP
jgi:hypothetical protein